MRFVIIESPYAGDAEANTEYARRCVRDSLTRTRSNVSVASLQVTTATTRI
jgi:hypothetical protein